jgi:hypothetical protein
MRFPGMIQKMSTDVRRRPNESLQIGLSPDFERLRISRRRAGSVQTQLDNMALVRPQVALLHPHDDVGNPVVRIVSTFSGQKSTRVTSSPAVKTTSELATSIQKVGEHDSIIASWRSVADFFNSIVLKGAKPADLPVEQPTRLDLVVNMKAAEAIGLAVPPLFLARADKVIE